MVQATAMQAVVDRAALFDFLLGMGDNALILGHRLSEWCGHAPALEEDIALANTALDLIGQTQLWLGFAGEVEGKGRSADDLAYLRDARDFRNLLLTSGRTAITADADASVSVRCMALSRAERPSQLLRAAHRRDRREGVEGGGLPSRTEPRSRDPPR